MISVERKRQLPSSTSRIERITTSMSRKAYKLTGYAVVEYYLERMSEAGIL